MKYENILYSPPGRIYINQRLSRAYIVHLVIKRTNWSYVKTISCMQFDFGVVVIKN
jgi:hypothetical protein